MSIVLAQNLVLSEGDGLTLDHPIIGWQSIVTVSNIEADTAEASYPVTNLANPATHLKWVAADTTEQDLTVTTGSADDVDYVGIAKHNLSSAAIPVSIGYLSSDSPPVWTELVAPALLPNDGPALFRFTPQPLETIRVRLGTGDDPASAAVLYTGKLLVLPRRLYQGFTPPSYGRAGKEVNAMSESGDYLGDIVTQRHVEAKVPLSLIDPTYQRLHIEPFLEDRPPFFFAWRPQTYPREIGYCKLTNWPQPAPQSPHSLIAYTLEMRGVA